MRAFVAIPIPEEQVAALERLRDALPVGRKVNSEGLHITLAFLDEQTQATLSALDGELRGVSVPEFEVRLRGVDVFGGKEPRLIWVGADGGEALVGLRKSVRDVARQIGIYLPRERYRPHVTLARFRKGLRPEESGKIGTYLVEYGGFSCPAFQVNGFALYRSVLTETGAVYTVLAEYPLGSM